MVFWEIIRILLGGKEKEAEEKKKKLGLTELEAAKYDIDREIRRIKELLPKAQKIIEEKLKEEPQNEILKKIYESYMEQIEWGKFSAAVMLIHLAAAIEKGLHKDPEKLIKYMIVAADKSARAIIRRIDYPHKEVEVRERYNIPWYGITDYQSYIDAVKRSLTDLSRKDPNIKKYVDLLRTLYLEAPSDYEKDYARYEQEVIDPLGKRLFPDIWGKNPEELLGIKKPEEEKPTGAPVLARPDRYPTLTQKILLKTLILGEHLREDNKGVHRDLYRALRNLLTTPLTTSNWYPLLTEWFENLEKGQHTSPLTQIIQKLPIHPTIKQEAYRYLAHIEQGKPIDQIPEEEKQAFKRVIEQIKQAIWLNPNRYAPVLEQLAYTTGMNPRDAAKALIGIIDDLAKVYTGEKTPRQVGIERDATQVIHTIKNLQDRGNYIDPYQLTQTLTNIIEQHIQDPLLKEAYKLAIKHYQETTHQVPRNHEYLERVMEKERELEEKLKQLAHGERRLTDTEAKRITMLYRTLMLLTPHPTLKETKQFYSQLAHKLKIRVGDEEFLPLHGPIAEDVATSYSAIRKAGPEEKEEVVKREIASFEPLFHTTPHIEKKVASILSTTFQPVVPKEKHEEFLGYLEVMQVRRPLE